MAQVEVVLTTHGMGDASEADFDAWASYVAARINERAGLDVSVDQARFGEGGGDRVNFADGVKDGDAPNDACETVREALRGLWDDFCADERSAVTEALCPLLLAQGTLVDKRVAAQVTVRDLTSGAEHRLPGPTRCIIAPGGFSEATGAAVMISDADGMVRLSYTPVGGGRETLEVVAGPLAGRGPVVAGFPIRRRLIRPGDRIFVESTDLDGDGRPMWWLSEVVNEASPIDAMRAAHKAYRESCEADIAASLDPISGIPSLFAQRSERTLALLVEAGDYAAGWSAADDEVVASADSCRPMRSAPPAGASAGFAAGWTDRIASESRS